MPRTDSRPRDSYPAAQPQAWEVLAAAARITRHVERARVDIELVSAIADLWRVQDVRLYQLTQPPAGKCRQIIALLDGNIVHHENLTPEHDEPVNRVSGADAALTRRQLVLEPIDGGVAALAVPVWDKHEQPVRLVHLTGLEAHLQRGEHALQALLDLYENHLNLIEDSERDTLTGLRNRRTFDHLLANLLTGRTHVEPSPSGFRRVTRSRDDGENWLAVLDIDSFKSINDRFGHLFGDEVLILVANLMQKCFRSHDPLFRFGGEEFVIVLCGVDRNGAEKAVERFRRSLETQNFPQVGQITISTGFTRIHEGQLSSEVLNQADAALYYAKENGRNRSCCYEQLVEDQLIRPLKRSGGSGFELF